MDVRGVMRHDVLEFLCVECEERARVSGMPLLLPPFVKTTVLKAGVSGSPVLALMTCPVCRLSGRVELGAQHE